MAKTLKIVLVKEFEKLGRVKSPRNVLIWGDKDWINIITYEDTLYVVMDEKAKAWLETRRKLPVGGSSRLLWKASSVANDRKEIKKIEAVRPPKTRSKASVRVPERFLFTPSDPILQKRYGKGRREMTPRGIMEFFQTNSDGLTEILDEIKGERMWGDFMLFPVEIVERYARDHPERMRT